MSLVFPKWTNSIPAAIVVSAGFAGVAVIAGGWYYMTPDYTEVGYEPEQPVNYSHRIHVNTLGMDCRYCHTNVEESGFSNIPDTATCMNCHTGDPAQDIAYLNSTLWSAHKQNENLVKVREAYASGEPIRWRRVHKVPDYAHFNHSVHVNAGVSCYSCHGSINEQAVVRQEKSLAMGWCLDCHRNPEDHLVRVSDTDPDLPKITDLDAIKRLLQSDEQKARGLELAAELRIEPPQSCGACHY